MVAPRRSPDAGSLPLPETPDLPSATPRTPDQLDARHRKVKDAVVAVAEMLVAKKKGARGR